LVRLQMADEMPPRRNIGGLANLLQAFLHLVLAELALTGVPRLTYLVDAERLRHRDQRYVRWRSARTLGCRSNPSADVRQVRGDGHWSQAAGSQPPASSWTLFLNRREHPL